LQAQGVRSPSENGGERSKQRELERASRVPRERHAGKLARDLRAVAARVEGRRGHARSCTVVSVPSRFAGTVAMFDRETWELLSYIVTAIGLPLAIVAFLLDQKKERDNEEEEVYQLLSDNYQDFLKIALDNPDLHLLSPEQNLSADQHERMVIIFNMLISLFERAYILLYEKKMSSKQARRWESWADYMREWCRREYFRKLLPTLLEGEDPEFAEYICGLGGITVPRRVPPQT
jgi:hypothetical protein